MTTNETQKSRPGQDGYKGRRATNDRSTDNVARDGGAIKPRREIWAASQDIADTSRQAWEALNEANEPERLFDRGGLPMRMNSAGELQVITPDRLHHELERSAYWYLVGSGRFEGRKTKAKPPRSVVSDMLAYPRYPLPPLKRIVGAPVFDDDGKLCAEQGYHKSGIYLTVKPDLPNLPPVKDAVTMIEDVIADFPFQEQADRANFYAFLIAPVVRPMIKGPTPAHLLEAQLHGTGKTLLAEIAFDISTGGRFEQTTPSHDEDELRKRITSLLMSGAGAIMIDNLETMVSSTIASALTSTRWTDRILGKSEIVTIDNNVIFALSGNNVALSGEIARRIVRIRLQARDDRPWERSSFLHPNIKTYVRSRRGQLQAAVVSIVQAWIDAGRPEGPSVPFGSFESYAQVIGGILHHAGVNGFMENRSALFEEADTVGAAWRAFTAEWYENFGAIERTASDLFPIAIETEGLLLEGKNEHAQKVSLGAQLAKFRDRVFGTYRIVRTGMRKRAVTWKLENMGESTSLGESLLSQSKTEINTQGAPKDSHRLTRLTHIDDGDIPEAFK